jgi:hypothetical protein
MWLWTFAAVLVAGALLIVRGWPRRRGPTPHCRKCGYNLTALTSNRCPECGASLKEQRSIVYGERHARRLLLVVGLLLVGVGGTLLGRSGYRSLKRVRWIHYYPVSWLTRDYQSDDLLTCLRAADELEDRFKHGRLPAAAGNDFIEMSLAEQTRPEMRLNPGGRALRLLGELLQGDRLSDEQRRRFLESWVNLQPAARPRIVVGDNWPIRIRLDTRIPAGYRAHLSIVDVPKPPGRELTIFDTENSGRTAPLNLMFPVPGLKAGPHRRIMKADVRLFAAAGQAEPIYTFARQFRFETDVLREEPPDFITLKRSPELDAAVHACLGPGCVTVTEMPFPDDEHMFVVAMQPAGPPPIDLAFEISVDGLPEVPMASYTLYSRLPFPEGAQIRLSRPAPATVTLTFKSSKLVARQTADMFEIWGGELRFPNVSVMQSQQTVTRVTASKASSPPVGK